MLNKLTSLFIASLLIILFNFSAKADVSDNDLLANPGDDWIQTNGNLAGHRYSTLEQINENTINNYGLEFVLNNTSNEYDLQSVYNGNSYIGIITDLSQVFLAIYDTTVSPQTYTGSENIDITNNEFSLNFPLQL